MYRGFPTMTLLSFLPSILGIVALSAWAGVWVRSRFCSGPGPISNQVNGFTPVVLLGLGGVLHYGVYSVLNAPLFHWYYSWSIVSLTYLFTLSLGALARVREPTAREVVDGAKRRPGVTVIVLSTALIAVAQISYNVQHGIPWARAAYNGNAAAPAEYAAVGLGIRPLVGDHAVRSPAEVGTIAYFCECEILDEFSDRGISLILLDQQRQHQGTFSRFLLDINFYFLDHSLKPTPVDYLIVYAKQRPANNPSWPTTGPSWIGNGYDVLVPLSSATR